MALGLTIGAIELGLYLLISHQLRKKWKQFGEDGCANLLLVNDDYFNFNLGMRFCIKL